MRRRQQFSERPAAHHIGSIRRIQPVRRGRLAALELQDGQRSGKTFDVFAHPAIETPLIDPMPLLDGPGARKFLVFPDALGHDDAPSIFLRKRPRGAPVNAWWERLHTSEVQVWQWRDYGPRPARPRG